MSVYLNLLKDCYESKGKQNKVVARQKCGEAPYELTLRFAGCNLSCGLCFASGYSWPTLYLKNKTVTSKKTVQDAVKDFTQIPPSPVKESYNWLRVLGGEPLLNDHYVDFLFQTLLKVSALDHKRFNSGIIIQTNGIHLGRGNTSLIESYLEKLHHQNPSVLVAIETSIKGSNPEEFKLLTQTRSEELFEYNLNSYFNLKSLNLPNLRPMIVAGFGPNESFLLRKGESKNKMTITVDGKRPCFHPDQWSNEFRKLYDAFTSEYVKLDPMFSKMPMYGIKDRFDLGWVKRALHQGKNVYADAFYDAKFTTTRNQS